MQDRMDELFADQFEHLKDQVVSLMASKLSGLLEENKNLRNEIEQLRESSFQTSENQEINQSMKEEQESVKKELSVIHNLSDSFNQKLATIEERSQKAFQGVSDEIMSIKDNVNTMLREVPQVTSIETRFASIEERISNSTEARVSLLNFNSCDDISCKDSHSQEEIMIAVAEEVDQRQQRRRSLVIHNLEESVDAENDNLQIKEIFHEITNDEKVTISQQFLTSYRLGKITSGRNRTIKVHLKSEEFCRRVIQNTWNMRNSTKYKNIVIQPDLTPLQRRQLKTLLKEKKLRNSYAEQCNEEPDWVIREGRLCRKHNLRRDRTPTTQDT